MQKILGLLGAKGAGKDTAAGHLVSTRGFIRVAFADKVYQEVAEAFGVTVNFLSNRSTKESDLPELAMTNCRDAAFVRCVLEESGRTRFSKKFYEQPRSPRSILQLWGTEYRRNRGVVSYWQDQVASVLDASPGASFVVTDVRFPDEAEFIRSRRGQLLRIRRLEVEAQEAASRAAKGTAAHSSETALLSYPVDAEAMNPEGAPEVLYQDIERFIEPAVAS